MYALTATTDILRADGARIPADPLNTDYREFLAWAAAGNTPGAYVAPPAPVPVSVDMAQARLALLDAGLLATVDAAVAAMTGPEGDAARIEWEFRATVRRDSPLVVALASALGLNGATLDALFTTASTL